MSSKQKSSKKTAPVKKAPAPVKKAVPAKKAPAPVKKVAAAKKAPAPVKKVAAAKNAPAPVKKVAPAKKAPALSKKVAPVKKAPVPVKKIAPAKKAPALSKKVAPAKKASAPVKQAVPAKKASAPVKKVAPAKKSPVAVKQAVPAKKASAPVKNAPVKPETKITPVKKVVVKEISAPVENELAVDKTSVMMDFPAVLLGGGKKITKVPFFTEVDEQEDRVNKKKVSSELKGVEKPTLPMRRKASLLEESPEELYERVVQELEDENQSLYKEASSQLCTKCCINFVSPEYRVDKDLGYCEDCAEILGLGHTKEARKLDYQMGLLGGDSLDEDQDDLEEKAPTPEDLEDEDLEIE